MKAKEAISLDYPFWWNRKSRELEEGAEEGVDYTIFFIKFSLLPGLFNKNIIFI